MKYTLLVLAFLAFNASADCTFTNEQVDLSQFDLNEDGVIDLLDLESFRSVFGTSGEFGDFNGDGVVNLPDYSLFREAFGTTEAYTVHVRCK